MRIALITFWIAIIFTAPLNAIETGEPELSLQEILNIVVYSQKREESIQDVSLSVTALDSQLLEAGNVDSIEDLGALVPGLVMGRSGYDPRPSLRGTRTQQVEHNDVAISVYQDGMYRSRHAQSMAPLFDLQRVEVLRGPQGTLYGRNSLGGSISIFSQEPEAKKSLVKVSGELGNFEQRKFTGVYNTSLGDSGAVRFSIFLEQREPVVENTSDNGKGLKDKGTQYIRAQYKQYLSSSSTLRFMIQAWKEESNGYGLFGYKILGVPTDMGTGNTSSRGSIVPRIGRREDCGSSCGRYGAGQNSLDPSGPQLAAKASSNPFEIDTDYASSLDLEENSVLIEFKSQQPIGQLSILGSYTSFTDQRRGDADYSPYSSVAEGYDMSSLSGSVEMKIASPKDMKVSWVAGLFALREDLKYAYLWQDIADLSENRPQANTPHKNEWASWQSQLQLRTDTYAAFGESRYSFTYRTRLIVGVRHTSDKRLWDLYGQNSDDLSTIRFDQNLDTNNWKAWESNTWKIGAESNLDNSSLLYGIASKGFLSGNFRSGQDAYDEQTVIAYELGHKYRSLSKTFRSNIALYYNLYDELLATEFDNVDGASQGKVTNAGEINAYGLELEIDWIPMTNLLLSLRGELSRAEYGHFLTSNPFEEGGETIDGNENVFQLKGDQVQNSPDYSLSFQTQYQYFLGDGSKSFVSLLVHNSDSYRVADEPYTFAEQDSFTTMDMSLGWRSKKNVWELKVFATNITSEEIKVRAARFGGNVAATDYRDPSLYGVKLSYQDI